MSASSLFDKQCDHFSTKIVDLIMVDKADELDRRVAAAFSEREASRERRITQISGECRAGLACKRLADGRFPEISAGQRVAVLSAYIYVGEEILRWILEPEASVRTRVSGLVAIDLAPSCMDISRAQLLQTMNLLSGKRCAPSDLSHFVAISISETARSRTLQMAPYEEGSLKSVTGFTVIIEEAVPFDMVAYGRNLMLKASAGSFPTIDLLYDYRLFLDKCSDSGRIGFFPEDVPRPKVAVIGAGISGLVVASELLHAGVDDVTIYEAGDRVGGKLWSHAFKDAPSVVAEMGAMRFPPAASCLFFFLERYGLSSMRPFPNPGTVDTDLVYEGCRYMWKAGQQPPKLFHRVYSGWHAFLKDGFLEGDIVLASPDAITEALKLGDIRRAHDAWQIWLNRFGRESFSSAIERIFLGTHPPGGETWSFPHDWDLFKLMGIGSGGFGPVFESGFIEILRLVINGYEENQRMCSEGISELPRRIASQVVNGVSVSQRIRHVQVRAVEKEKTKIKIRLKSGISELYDKVVVTSGLANIQLRHRLTSDTTIFRAPVNQAVDNSHMTGSSKLFLLTERKFWFDHMLPSCVLMDGVAKAVYCLDYEPQDPNGKGVVLISYTWEDDSHKLLAIPDKKERLCLLRDAISKSFPAFARHLVPACADYDQNVVQHDWLTDENAGGAFKLNRRGEDFYSEELFFQALDMTNDTGVYLAGCSCSFTGGWVEGAIQTACNAVCAIIHNCGGVLAKDNPLEHSWRRYNYRNRN
ncbi:MULTISPECIES: FAD-dependent oxidoreductase [Rhizobium/Agrobacterium group]|uniref:Tryptophan 2-monooxygenase n=3 Tax=Rhizobium/Agrobacterium group TaxID=227290 RepID=A0A7S4ZTQ5_AGRTU|nr:MULTISPECIES: FAD-dependent oxidoreductase [Rhizobium]NSY72471.1 NAD(P)-binding protein [Agrobacterium tumefaciens]QXZ93736.1 FAD-dependent oxidoreductase [Rhizobium sp. K15/93]QYA05232.1 FAD-dependent oxidoreductase [Rhizobium sp. B21/90]MBO9102086.1 FAD-dependent oxidoreductase [Rhizobium sp. L58/93]MBO9172234.1 FAD-dependent oxidoreductase [Rhizobium sp. L245/93]